MYTPSGINLSPLWTRQVPCQLEDDEIRTRPKNDSRFHSGFLSTSSGKWKRGHL